MGVHHAQRRQLGQGFDEKLKLLAIGPDLPFVDALNALAEQAEGIPRKTKRPSCAGAEGIDHGIAVLRFQQQNLSHFRVSQMHPAHQGHVCPIGAECGIEGGRDPGSWESGPGSG